MSSIGCKSWGYLFKTMQIKNLVEGFSLLDKIKEKNYI